MAKLTLADEVSREVFGSEGRYLIDETGRVLAIVGRKLLAALEADDIDYRDADNLRALLAELEGDRHGRPIGRYFYRCRWPECGELSPKEDWGPGWITCPTCKRTAMSAAESHHHRHPEILGVPTPEFCDQCQSDHAPGAHLFTP